MSDADDRPDPARQAAGRVAVATLRRLERILDILDWGWTIFVSIVTVALAVFFFLKIRP